MVGAIKRCWLVRRESDAFAAAAAAAGRENAAPRAALFSRSSAELAAESVCALGAERRRRQLMGI